MMLRPAPVERDEHGYWLHPDLEDIPVDTPLGEHPAAEGMELAFRLLHPDEGEVADRYFRQGAIDISAWEPAPPAGDGWFIVAIYDTEEGACCAFARGGR